MEWEESLWMLWMLLRPPHFDCDCCHLESGFGVMVTVQILLQWKLSIVFTLVFVYLQWWLQRVGQNSYRNCSPSPPHLSQTSSNFLCRSVKSSNLALEKNSWVYFSSRLVAKQKLTITTYMKAAQWKSLKYFSKPHKSWKANRFIWLKIPAYLSHNAISNTFQWNKTISQICQE